MAFTGFAVACFDVYSSCAPRKVHLGFFNALARGSSLHWSCWTCCSTFFGARVERFVISVVIGRALRETLERYASLCSTNTVVRFPVVCGTNGQRFAVETAGFAG